MIAAREPVAVKIYLEPPSYPEYSHKVHPAGIWKVHCLKHPVSCKDFCVLLACFLIWLSFLQTMFKWLLSISSYANDLEKIHYISYMPNMLRFGRFTPYGQNNDKHV